MSTDDEEEDASALENQLASLHLEQESNEAEMIRLQEWIGNLEEHQKFYIEGDVFGGGLSSPPAATKPPIGNLSKTALSALKYIPPTSSKALFSTLPPEVLLHIASQLEPLLLVRLYASTKAFSAPSLSMQGLSLGGEAAWRVCERQQCPEEHRQAGGLRRPSTWRAAAVAACVAHRAQLSRAVSAADGVTSLVQPDGSVISCGGRLGSGGFTVQGTWDHDDVVHIPSKVPELARIHVVQVAAASCHSVALSLTGEVFTWGSVPSLGFSSRPIRVMDGLQDTFVTHIAAGHGDSSAAVGLDGAVYTWGEPSQWNRCMLGHGVDLDYKIHSPRRIEALRDVPVLFVELSEASAVSFFIDALGLVYSCGDGSSAALGHGDTLDRGVPTLIEALTEHVVTHVAAGSAHSAFVTARGDVYTGGLSCPASGHGDAEQRWQPEKLSLRQHGALPVLRVVAVAAADQLSVFVCANGSVYACGMDRGGEWEQKVPVQVPRPLVARGGAAGAACGGVLNVHVVLVDAEGRLYVGGANNNAQLGQGERDSHFEWPPIEAGAGISLSAAHYDSDEELLLLYRT